MTGLEIIAILLSFAVGFAFALLTAPDAPNKATVAERPDKDPREDTPEYEGQWMGMGVDE